METISLLNLWIFFVLYSFLGWLSETTVLAVTKRRFTNRGILTLPLLLSYGTTFVLMLLVLPSLGGKPFFQFIVTLVDVSVVDSLSNHIMRRISPRLEWGEEDNRLFSGNWKGIIYSLAIAGICYLVYLMVHPLLLALVVLIPRTVSLIFAWVSFGLVVVDLIAEVIAIRSGDQEALQRREDHGSKRRFSVILTYTIWRRIQKAYPGVHEMTETDRGKVVFAKGLCMDKLIWVFLVSALLGDLIETLYCRLVGGSWMSRSSVLYGPFSFVWGLGAVLLTVSLHRLTGKNDRWVFLAGFVIGGVYEYMCSVFTELVFGTVFWDYSAMPLNIGGRTNVLFCFFWGVLAVVWVKVLYPPMSGIIEKFPVVIGKVLTWSVVFLMLCNAVLTCGAMLRYDSRADRPEPANAFEAFLDRQYGDEYMENRWPNMRPAGDAD